MPYLIYADESFFDMPEVELQAVMVAHKVSTDALAEADLAATHIPGERVADYQPYWVVSAHLLKQPGRKKAAEAAYTRAIALCEDSAVRAFLVVQKNALSK